MMRTIAARVLGCLVAVLLVGAAAGTARALPEVPSEPAPGDLMTELVYLGKKYAEPPPLSLLDKILTDEGVQGARLAIKENNKTGRLIAQHFEIKEVIAGENEDVAEKAAALFAAGEKLIVADLATPDLIAVADLPAARDAVILNIRSSDDRLRQELCRDNIFHIIPNWAMRADALAQYLIWKKWRNWFLITGNSAEDKDFGEAIRRSAMKFGAKIVHEKTYEFQAGSRRTDTGHQQIQTQMPLLTQGAPAHDVIVVADINEAFGDYLMFRTYEPRPVAGSHGLQAVAWHRSFEQYAGTQLQNRFERQAGRVMTERDYTAWLGVRVFGEVLTRIAMNEPQSVKRYILSKAFEVAGFKGLGLTFRSWDQQMRQPVLLSGPRSLVSISPQDGFLHQKFHTDTLGFDQPESKCRLNN